MKAPLLLVSFLCALSLSGVCGSAQAIAEAPDEIVIENQELRLVIGS